MRRMRLLCPTLPLVAYRFPRFIGGLMSTTALGIVPASWLPLPADYLWSGFSVHQPCGILGIVDPFIDQVVVADAELVREIVTRRADFPKPTALYRILNIFGDNVVTTEHAEWRRHRKIVTPAFSEKNNAVVFKQTLRSVQNMFAAWSALPLVSLPAIDRAVLVDVTDDMMKLALHVISSAAFGVQLSWDDADDTAALAHGHHMSFKTATQEVIHNLKLKLALPAWAYSLPVKKFQHVKLVFAEFETYLREMVRDAETQTEANLLVSLVRAAKADNPGEAGLTEQELIGNMFIFMFAGHETTANALTYALALLASRPDKQQRIFEEVQHVFGNAVPEYKKVNELVYTLAVMNETLRMYPPVVEIPKITTKDREQKLGEYLLPAGCRVGIHTYALHRNPKYWGPDATEFRPERWFTSQDCAASAVKASAFLAAAAANKNPTSPARTSQTAPEDASQSSGAGSIFTFNRYAFLPFSEGVRSCVGKRFAQVEFVAALSLIVRQYTIHLPPGVTSEQVLESSNRITLQTTRPVHLLFRPRSG
ncbi:cytochrome P450 [Entophlyctis helioformis]|nr:cytochrome P450 [Entophlyctis helioformis]